MRSGQVRSGQWLRLNLSRRLHDPQTSKLLGALEASFTFARDFNSKIQLRLELKRLGFMREMRDLPGLLKQERESLTCYLEILFGLYNLGKLDTELGEKLILVSRSVLKNYVSKDRLMHTMMRQGDDEVEGGRGLHILS